MHPPGRRITVVPGGRPTVVRDPRQRRLSQPERNVHQGPAPIIRRRLLERLGKLDEALVEGRISPEQYEEMKARAEQEFGGWEA